MFLVSVTGLEPVTRRLWSRDGTSDLGKLRGLAGEKGYRLDKLPMRDRWQRQRFQVQREISVRVPKARIIEPKSWPRRLNSQSNIMR